MIGKKDNNDIFNQYKRVLLEQVEENNVSNLINKVKVSSLDGKTKSEILDLLSDKTVQDVYKIISLRKNSGFVDQDTANPQDPRFANEMLKAQMDQDDTEVVNKPDPKFAEELERERKKQQEEYPEKEESEENGYSDPSSFFTGGGPDNISKLGPMKFPTPQPPEQKTLAETDPEGWAKYQKDKADALRKQKQEAIEKLHAGRGKASNYDPNIKIGADPSDPAYAKKKAKWLTAFSAGAGR